MTQVSNDNFGLLIAYLIPGFIIVLALSGHFPIVAGWLGTAASGAVTVGGFLYVTLASVSAGMLVSALRWIAIDTLHHLTGVPRPTWNLAALPHSLPAFNTFVEFHYRYYQAYANALVALLLATAMGLPEQLTTLPGYAAVAVTAVILFAASRDAMRKYYVRTNALLLPSAEQGPSNHDQRLPRRETSRD